MNKKLKIILASLLFILPSTLVSCNKSAKLKVYDSIELVSESYAFAIKKGNSELQSKVNQKLSEMISDTSLDNLINAYFNGKASFTYKNPEVKAPSAGTENYFVVGTNAYFPPFETYASNGDFYGVDIEIANILANHLNKTLYVIDMEFDALISSVNTNKCDIVMAGMTVNESRKQSVDFCDLYYESSQVLITREDDERFKNCTTASEIETVLSNQSQSFKVGAQNATTGYMYSHGDEDFGYEGFSNLTTQGYTSGALALKDLANGKIDAVILDKQPALMMTAEKSNSALSTFWKYFSNGGYIAFFNGLGNTAIIALLGLVIGFVIGCLVALVKLIPNKNIGLKILQGIGDVYVTIFRGTPMVVQLLLIHFALFPLIGINISSVAEAVIIFGLNSGAYMSEMIRSGINSIDKGQMEAGRCIGLPYSQTMIKIILPQAIKNILPTIGNELISLIKETSVVSFIAVVDITKSLQNIAASTYEYFIPYIFLALVYLLLVLLITYIIKILEKRLAKNERK